MRHQKIFAAILCLSLIGAATWFGATASAQKGVTGTDIDLASALRVVNAAVEKARATDTKMNIAVVDAGGNLKAFVRMDGAFLGSIDVAQKKALTARLFDMPTATLGELSQPGGSLYGIETSNGGLIVFGGGFPLKNASGVVIGAIGVSGSTVQDDEAVAQAGVKAL